MRKLIACWASNQVLLFLCCLLLQPSPLAHAQSDLSGYWVLHVPNGDGTVRDTYFELKEDGESITGTLLGRGPNGTPISGTFKDGKLQFATVPPAAAATPPVPSGKCRMKVLIRTENSPCRRKTSVTKLFRESPRKPRAKLPCRRPGCPYLRCTTCRTTGW